MRNTLLLRISRVRHCSQLLGKVGGVAAFSYWELTCKLGSVGQSKGLLIPMSSVRCRLKPGNSNSHGFELHRPSIKSAKLLLKVIKAIIIIKPKKNPNKQVRWVPHNKSGAHHPLFSSLIKLDIQPLRKKETKNLKQTHKPWAYWKTKKPSKYERKGWVGNGPRQFLGSCVID